MFLGPAIFRGQFKPSGTPRLGVGAPRGFRLAAHLADPSYGAVAANGFLRPAAIGSAVTLTPTRGGSGMAPNGSTTGTGCVSYQTTNVSFPVSIEAWFVANGSTTRSICAFNGSSDGTSGTADKGMGIDGSGFLFANVFAGSSVVVTDTSQTYTSGQIVHGVMTFDGTTLKLYTNGVLKASAAAGSSFTGFAPPYFCMGTCITGGVGIFGSITSVLFASVADAAWTAAEVAGRYADPFGFLLYPMDDLRNALVGVVLGTVRPRLLTATYKS